MPANQSPPTRPLEGFDNRVVNSAVLKVETSAGNRGLGSIDREILASRTHSTPRPSCSGILWLRYNVTHKGGQRAIERA